MKTLEEVRASARARTRHYRERHPDRVLASNLKQRARGPDYRASIHLLNRFGIDIAQKRRMIVQQGGRCAGCGNDILRLPARLQHVDHDHAKKKGEPGFIRGILCHNCNVSLGLCNDSAERLESLAAYRRRFS